MQRVAVIGGGIAGLAAAYRLAELARQHESPLQLTLLERSNRLGGPIHTVCEDGFVIECGADSFISEKPWAIELAHRLGLEHQLVPTTTEFRRTMVVCRGRLTDIPAGFQLMAPVDLMPIMKSPILSLRGKLRLMLELILPRHAAAEDESLAAFVTRRMGREVLDRLAQPLAAGIYTGDPAVLSIEATLPRFAELESHYGSVIRGLKAVQKKTAERRASGARWGLFLSFTGGMQTIVDALRDRLAEMIRMETGVQALQPASGAKWRLALNDGTTIEADAVICAARASDAAALATAFDPELASHLSRIGYSSAATVNLAFRETDLRHMPDSFGFVVPAVERRRIIAGSFSSLKFAARAPAGSVLLRVFMGGAMQRDVMALDDAQMAAAARAEIADLLGIVADPMLTRVARWNDSMPQYAVGHLALVAQIEERVRMLGGFLLAGAAYRGVGIPDCIHSGEQAAETAWAYLQTTARQSAA
jgi:oxygen-dependent protoporphyrinogen oxidase